MSKRQTILRRLFAPAIRRGGAMARDEKGAVAVEFAILALPFFTVIFAILETSMVFLAQQILDSAVQDATRYIRTGQAQSTELNWGISDFRTAVCNGLFNMFDCNSTDRLRIKVSVISKFADSSTTVTSPIPATCTVGSTAAQCDWTLASSYDDGKGSDVILAQVYYKWPTIVNLPYFNLANQAGSSRLLSTVRVFKNEPF